jgi:hypothetical protein
MKKAREDFGALSVVTSNSRLRLNETSLEDALQTESQPKRLGLERLHRQHCAMGAKLAAKATEERKDENCLAKTSMTCLPVTGFDKITKKPKWVECKDNKRLNVNY